MRAGACTFVVGSPFRIVAPRVDPRVFFASHVVTSARVHHAIASCSSIQTGFLEFNVAKALECCGIGDMSARGLRRRLRGGDEDPCHRIRRMRKEASQTGSSWTCSHDEELRLRDRKGSVHLVVVVFGEILADTSSKASGNTRWKELNVKKTDFPRISGGKGRLLLSKRMGQQ